MNGRAFAGLNVLNEVMLQENVCINENFRNTSIASIVQDTNKKCAFPETFPDITEHLDTKFENLETFMNKFLEEKEKHRKEFNVVNAELAAKTVELKTAQSAKNQAEAQISEKNLRIEELRSELKSSKTHAEVQLKFIQNICEKLETQYNQTFAAKAQELNEKLEHKIRVNEELIEENQKKSEEINQKNLKIKQLEEKNRILSANEW